MPIAPTYSPDSSTVVAPCAYALTDSMPLFAEAFVVYQRDVILPSRFHDDERCHP
jgi:hypothetical protein